MGDAREKILARRAKFVAAALAGVTVAGTEACKPQPCLEIAPAPSDTAPGPCLSAPWVPPVDAGGAEDAGTDGGSVDATDASRTADAGDASVADPGKTRAAAADAGSPDAGSRLKPIPPATRHVRPPAPPPRPCLLMHLSKEEE